jgi:hypothetical protein
VYQSFRMHPAQRVPSDGELPRVIAQDDAIAQEFVRMDAAPQSKAASSGWLRPESEYGGDTSSQTIDLPEPVQEKNQVVPTLLPQLRTPYWLWRKVDAGSTASFTPRQEGGL